MQITNYLPLLTLLAAVKSNAKTAGDMGPELAGQYAELQNAADPCLYGFDLDDDVVPNVTNATYTANVAFGNVPPPKNGCYNDTMSITCVVSGCVEVPHTRHSRLFKGHGDKNVKCPREVVCTSSKYAMTAANAVFIDRLERPDGLGTYRSADDFTTARQWFRKWMIPEAGRGKYLPNDD
ncbi:hypothetical protein ANO11243_015750 [Dothideomycetidae sp. 11243]|nr:hypothetical protein ANO11243_015750 [fungal sp. No.11243]